MTADAVGGVWQYALDLAEGLRPRGFTVTLAVLGPSPSADQIAAAQRAGVTLVDTGLPLDWLAESAGEVEEAGRALARIAAEARPDIIHLNAPALAACASFPAPVLAVCHSCVATWWQANRSGPLPADFAWQADLVRRGYEAADLLVAPTAAFAAATAIAYRLPAPPRVVRNGRRAAAPPGGDMADFVFTAGRLWDEGKNVATLDRAASILSVPVLAAGPLEGPNRAWIALQHARPVGRLSEAGVTDHLSARPIFASVARYEPFGLAVLEAAQAGCALILSDIPTFRELWEGAAVFVAPEDHAALARATEALLRDPHTRARLGNAAHARATAYSIDAMCDSIASLYASRLPARTASQSAEEAAV